MYKNFYTFVVTCVLLHVALHADKITIANKTDKPVFAAFYYTKGVTCERMQDKEILNIAVNETKTVERPDLKLYFGGTYDRDLYFSYDKADFPDTITKGARHFVNLGTTRGNNFYIAMNERNELDGYNDVSWAARPLMQTVADVIYETNRNTFLKAPHVNDEARVRQGNNLSSGETGYIQQRASVTAAAISTAAQIPAQYQPRIAICCSGGGYRAMISTAGFINGLDKAGLLNAVTYQAGLSGSTWAMSAWLQSGKSIDTFLQDLSGKLNTDIRSNVGADKIINTLLNSLSFSLPVSLVYIWGSLIGQKVLLPDSNKFTIADLAEKSQPGRHPYSIFTAVLSSRNLGNNNPWAEFTPHEIGSTYLNAYIPVWAFGRKFEKGTSSKQGYSIFPPAQPLDFCMGIWGSAIAVNVNDIINNKLGSGGAAQLVLDALKGSAIAENRLAGADVFNWAYGVSGAQLADLPKFQMIDAGLDFNLPLPPLLRPERAVDIIIVLDASASLLVNPAAEIKSASAYAAKNNLKFPTIDYATTKNNCSVHYGDPKRGSPTIIYIPLVGNPGYQNGWYLDPKNDANYTRTENFAYSADQVKQLSGLTEYTAIASKNMIIEAIKQVAIKKGAPIS